MIPIPPAASQVGFIKDNASMSQIVYLDAGVYNLSVLAAQRLNYNTQNENVEVLVHNVQGGGVIDPASPVQVNNSTVYTVSYRTYQSWNFAVAAGDTPSSPRPEPGNRRQHHFSEQRRNHAGPRRDRQRQFRAALTARERLPDRPLRFGLAVLGNGRRGPQRQRLPHELGGSPERSPGSQVAYLENTVVNGVSTVGSMSQTLSWTPAPTRFRSWPPSGPSTSRITRKLTSNSKTTRPRRGKTSVRSTRPIPVTRPTRR